MKYVHAEYVPVFKALFDETRLKIIEMLSCGEMCAYDILEFFHITQPTLSYHMKVLTESGLIDGRRDGAWMKYRINLERVSSVKDFLDCITTEQETCICKGIAEMKKCEQPG
jgi:transcriptional regulator, ArsR family